MVEMSERVPQNCCSRTDRKSFTTHLIKFGDTMSFIIYLPQNGWEEIVFNLLVNPKKLICNIPKTLDHF